MKIHKIYTKEPEVPWIIYTGMRLSNDFDPRDAVIHNNDSMTEKDFFNIIVPYRLLTINYEGYVGYDRRYISDEVANFWYVFDLPKGKTALEFASQYMHDVNDINNPIVKNALEVYDKHSRIEDRARYEIRWVIEDDDGKLIDLSGNPTTI